MLSEKARVLIVDDHPVMRQSLASLLGEYDWIEVVGGCGDALTGVDLAKTLAPQLVLLDIDLPGYSAFDAAERILQLDNGSKIVFLSAYWTDFYIEQALNLGVSGYLTKNESVEGMVGKLQDILRGQRRYSDEVLARLNLSSDDIKMQEGSSSRLSSLTARERGILLYMATGLSRKEIAQKSGVAEVTVASHMRNIMDKLGGRNRVELTRIAIREGLLKP